jgi:putative flippase GtrA
VTQLEAAARCAPVVLVVPCYNEETRLDAAAFETYLKQEPDVAIVFVNDGSTDQTAALLDRLQQENPSNAIALHCAKNGGKAEAVRLGLLRALADGAKYIGYWDADLATPLEEVMHFRRVLDERTEIELVLGARIRLLGRDISRHFLRHYLGRVFATGASLCLNLPVYDTQCGAKLLRVGPITHGLLSEPFGSRWIFDVELLARYMAARGDSNGLYEYALSRWRDVGESKVKPRDFFRSIGDLLRIYRGYSLRQPLRPVVLLATNLFSVYALVGALGTVVHYSILIVTVELFHVPATVAVVLGASAGALTNYVMNYHMIFTSTAKHRETLPRFALVAAMATGVSWYGAKLAVRFHFNYLLAQLGSTVLVLILGFLLNRYWTFAKRST